MMDECVNTIGLCKRYGSETCVDHLALKVPQGAVYGFLGPNGAGKTTTLKMLLGLVHPSAGSVRLLGHELTPRTRLAVLREVGSLIESPSYYGHLTARENLEIVRRLRGLPAEEIDEALRTVRLDGQTKKPVNHFSLGMKQRLGIAAALMGRPRLLLLDEPTNGLDPSGIQEMRELIRSLPSRYGMTVIVSSHLLGEIDQMADHVGVIRQGRLVFQGTMSGLHGMSAARLALRTQDNARARSLLPAARSEGEWLLLDAMSDSEAARVSLKLAGAGIGLVRMEQRETSLEDIFLRLTGTEETL